MSYDVNLKHPVLSLYSTRNSYQTSYVVEHSACCAVLDCTEFSMVHAYQWQLCFTNINDDVTKGFDVLGVNDSSDD